MQQTIKVQNFLVIVGGGAHDAPLYPLPGRETACSSFLQKACVNDWIDKYHISMGNCYRSRDDAIDDMYDMLEKITGEDGYTVWLRDGKE